VASPPDDVSRIVRRPQTRARLTIDHVTAGRARSLPVREEKLKDLVLPHGRLLDDVELMVDPEDCFDTIAMRKKTRAGSLSDLLLPASEKPPNHSPVRPSQPTGA